jgi:PHS family inorganic phosphate transporter-like MFS transporter
MASGIDENSQSRLAVALSAFGLMADLYDFGIVNLLRPILAEDYGAMTPTEDALITGSALAGSFIGMIAFGTAADHVGRRLLFITTATIVGIASIGSACAGEFLGMRMYTVLILWRFILGLGIGGEYPLAASFAAESTDTATSAYGLAATFAGMGAGQLLAPSIMMLMAGPLGITGSRLWRYAFAFGAVLALMVAVIRLLVLRETRAWEAANRPSAPGQAAAVQPSTSMAEKSAALAVMKNSVIGTVGSWMIYDVVAYGCGLYSTSMFPASAGYDSSRIVFFIALISLPGYLIGMSVPSICRMKYAQMAGLIGMAVFLSVLAYLQDKVDQSSYVLISLFGLMRCIDCMGPGVSTFVIPGQIYPTRIRATGHGMSAAAGKAGAVVGAVMVPLLHASSGLKTVFMAMVAFSLLAVVWTHIFTPLYDSSVLEEIAKMDTDSVLINQASKAEILLFAGRPPIGTKAETTVLIPEKSSSGKATYGAGLS